MMFSPIFWTEALFFFLQTSLVSSCTGSSPLLLCSHPLMILVQILSLFLLPPYQWSLHPLRLSLSLYFYAPKILLHLSRLHIPSVFFLPRTFTFSSVFFHQQFSFFLEFPTESLKLSISILISSRMLRKCFFILDKLEEPLDPPIYTTHSLKIRALVFISVERNPVSYCKE